MLQHYIILAIVIFSIGIFGLIRSKNSIIDTLLSVEVMLLSSNILFVAFGHFIGDIVGQIFTIFVLSVAAGEVSIGLAIAIIHFRNKHNISLDNLSIIKNG